MIRVHNLSFILFQGPLSPVSVTIPRPELFVLEPPSPYRNPTDFTVPVETPTPKHFYFGERASSTSSSVAENALISETGNIDAASVSSSSSTIEVINFGPV